ncbi:hypothetical protein ACFQUU_12515 [Herbaspirillum sp. GCM10030257]|uniref:hypothetical protein n=1 Tax=Herbaspirillum sp. GCM10030257 TaxID=3273393 RepID=UPI003605CBEF
MLIVANECQQEFSLAHRADVAFFDIGMPGMTGYVRIVAVTGWGTDEDRGRSKDAGFDSHFTKPLSSAAITKFIDEL